MLRIGLTGGIGSGKSIVAEMFRELGVPVIDADRVSHQLTSNGSECLAKIREVLGPIYITPDNKLDRDRLASDIFRNPETKKTLENILHPQIRKQMTAEMNKLGDTAYVVLVVPLLFETNFIELVDRVLVVDAPEKIRIKRVMERDARNEQQIRDILKNQMDQSKKTEIADDVLDNSGTLEQLHASVNKLHLKYMKIANT